MIILAIETSCDETAAAIVKFEKNKVKTLANIVSSQVKAHSKYGGVVPSLASRMHLKNMVPVLRKAFKLAKIKKNNVDYIAVTNGPGLIPALMIGTQAAKTLAYALNKPLVPINHIEGHIYANWLRPISENVKCQMSNVKKIPNSKFPAQGWSASGGKIQNSILWQPEFPILCLIVSGGHTQLILMKKDLDYKIIGETVDDAAGEAFDKVAKLLGVGYPGGPLIEKMAKLGDRNKFKFPRPMINSNDYNFSFSGLKTAVLYKLKLETGNLEIGKLEGKTKSGAEQNIPYPKSPITNHQLQYKADIAASFQQAAIDVLISKTIKAAKEYKVKNIILGGGVSANKELQKQFVENIREKCPISDQCQKRISDIRYPISILTTDNALMIAVAAYYHIVNNRGIKRWKNVKADANLVSLAGSELQLRTLMR